MTYFVDSRKRIADVKDPIDQAGVKFQNQVTASSNQANAVIRAAVSGKTHYVTDILVSAPGGATSWLTLTDGTTAISLTLPILAGTHSHIPLVSPMSFGDNKPISWTATITASTYVQVLGYTL